MLSLVLIQDQCGAVSSRRQEWWQMKAEPRLEWEENNNYSRYLWYYGPKCKSGLRPNGLSCEGHE
jgi:hypothetical protein